MLIFLNASCLNTKSHLKRLSIMPVIDLGNYENIRISPLILGRIGF